MQESLFNTVKKLQAEQKINVEELEIILNSGIEDVVALCKKACLKPKTDSMGNAYFTKDDVDMLKKMKEIYSQSQNPQQQNTPNQKTESTVSEKLNLSNPNKKINFLERAKSRVKNETTLAVGSAHPVNQLSAKLDILENNLVGRISDILSEKMDGFDEIIVELIRSKTENENLRQQVNSLSKQVFILKKELASFNAHPFGLYTKKDVDSL